MAEALEGQVWGGMIPRDFCGAVVNRPVPLASDLVGVGDASEVSLASGVAAALACGGAPWTPKESNFSVRVVASMSALARG